MSHCLVHVDGGCWPNPGGPASYGFTVDIDGQRARAEAGPCDVPQTSNNVAEHYAVLQALRWLLDNGHADSSVLVRGDSRLVIEQMSGHWRIGDGRYRDVALEAYLLRRRFKHIRFAWIPREQNAECDALAASWVDDQLDEDAEQHMGSIVVEV